MLSTACSRWRSNGQVQRRLLSAVLSPAAETRHGADGQVLVDKDGGFRALQLKKSDWGTISKTATLESSFGTFVPLDTSGYMKRASQGESDCGRAVVGRTSTACGVVGRELESQCERNCAMHHLSPLLDLMDAEEAVTRHVCKCSMQVSVLHGDGEQFCSGLDLASLRGGHQDKVKTALRALCEAVTSLGTSKTPTVSVMDGSCVGSGYALSMGKYRFATENSVFYVPEATLGLGLAGGLSYALPRLLGGNQPLALCLALSGMALEGPDLFFTQIATNYITHRRLDMMMQRLAEVNQDPKPFGEKTPDCSEDATAVQTVLERSGDLSWNVDGLADDILDPTDGSIPITRFVHDLLPQVEQVFAVDKVEEAIGNLKGVDEPWAQTALKNMESSSPLSLKVIFEQVKRGGGMTLQECLDDEFSVNTRLFDLPDFEMAMQARDLRGGTPAWKCGSIEQVSEGQVAAIFDPVPRSG